MSRRAWVLRAGLGALGLVAIVAVAWETWQQADQGEPSAPAYTASEAGARAAGEAVEAAPAGAGPADTTASHSAAPHDTPAAREGAASAALASVARLGRAAAPAPQGPAIAADQFARSTVRVGQRIRVAGTLSEQVVGEPGVTVVVLATDAGPGLPLVWSPAHVAALDGLQAGAPMEADCLVQGEVMGRWLLADCRP